MIYYYQFISKWVYKIMVEKIQRSKNLCVWISILLNILLTILILHAAFHWCALVNDDDNEVLPSNYRYFKVLVQEMSLKVDQGFLNNIIDLFTSSQAIHRDQEVNVWHIHSIEIMATLYTHEPFYKSSGDFNTVTLGLSFHIWGSFIWEDKTLI